MTWNWKRPVVGAITPVTVGVLIALLADSFAVTICAWAAIWLSDIVSDVLEAKLEAGDTAP